MPSPSDLAFRVLRLEQQLESYQRLHADELAEIRRALDELAAEVLALAVSRPAAERQTAERPPAATPSVAPAAASSGPGTASGPAEMEPG